MAGRACQPRDGKGMVDSYVGNPPDSYVHFPNSRQFACPPLSAAGRSLICPLPPGQGGTRPQGGEGKGCGWVLTSDRGTTSCVRGGVGAPGWDGAQIVRGLGRGDGDCHLGCREWSHGPTNGRWRPTNGWHGGCIWLGTGRRCARRVNPNREDHHANQAKNQFHRDNPEGGR